jgi:hypothetical protein
MPLYTFIHNLLNVLVQLANKMGLKNRMSLCADEVRLLHVKGHCSIKYGSIDVSRPYRPTRPVTGLTVRTYRKDRGRRCVLNSRIIFAVPSLTLSRKQRSAATRGLSPLRLDWPLGVITAKQFKLARDQTRLNWR